jgi:hypothetical protein
MQSESTSAHKRAIAPAARKDRAEILEGQKPVTDVQRSAVRSGGVRQRKEAVAASKYEAKG